MGYFLNSHSYMVLQDVQTIHIPFGTTTVLRNGAHIVHKALQMSKRRESPASLLWRTDRKTLAGQAPQPTSSKTFSGHHAHTTRPNRVGGLVSSDRRNSYNMRRLTYTITLSVFGASWRALTHERSSVPEGLVLGSSWRAQHGRTSKSPTTRFALIFAPTYIAQGERDGQLMCDVHKTRNPIALPKCQA